MCGDSPKHLSPGGPEALEAGELGLDGNTGGGSGVDEGAAVSEDGRGNGIPARDSAIADLTIAASTGPRPERGRMGVETEDDLRLALGDVRGEGVAEGRRLSAP